MSNSRTKSIFEYIIESPLFEGFGKYMFSEFGEFIYKEMGFFPWKNITEFSSSNAIHFAQLAVVFVLHKVNFWKKWYVSPTKASQFLENLWMENEMTVYRRTSHKDKSVFCYKGITHKSHKLSQH